MIEMSTVWDRTTAFVSSARAAVLPIAAGLLFVPIAVQTAIQPSLDGAAPLLRIVVTLVLSLAGLTGTLALIVLALGATNSAGEAVRAALARLPATVGILLLLGVLAAVAAIPIGIAFGMSHIDMATLRAGGELPAGAISPGVAIFLALFGIFYAVLMIWAAARLLVIEPVILAERRGIVAIRRAFSLTRGLTWRIIGVTILYAIVSTVAVLAAREVFGGVFGLFAGGDGTITVADVLTAIVVGIVSAGFKTVAAVFVGKLYVAIADHADAYHEPS